MPVVADLVLRDGTIWRGRGAGRCTALAVRGERVLATGDEEAIAALVGPGTRVVDLAGRLAVPGLNDAHLHLLPLGLAMLAVDVRPEVVPTLDALLGRIAAAAADRPPGSWIVARGYDHFALDVRRHPTADELERAAPGRPCVLVRACGHIWVASRSALAAAGLDDTAESPPGGLVEKRDGRLTGLLAEHARAPVERVMPAPSDAELVDAIERAGRHCLERGVTSVMDAAVGIRAGMREIEAYREARRAGRLPVRTHLCLLGEAQGIVEECWRAGLVTGAGDAMLGIGPVKIFTDGSAGGRTAAMSEPYLGEPGGTGILCLPDDELRALVASYHARGYRLAPHAIGDRAIDRVLDAYEGALEGRPAHARRHRIEHCGFVRDDQLSRMRALGIEPSPQPVFVRDFGDLYRAVLGEARAARAYPLRTWLERGFHPAVGTDAPVCAVDPLPNLHAMLTRRTRSGTVLGPEQRVEVEDALYCYTEAGARLEGSEAVKGRLLPDMLADIAVFDRDLLAIEPDALLEARCDLAIRGGAVVFERRE